MLLSAWFNIYKMY